MALDRLATLGRRKSYFDQSADEFENIQSKYNPEVPQSGPGLTASDWAGMGMQLYGGVMQDKAAEAERIRAERERDEMKALGLRQDRQSAQENERAAMQTDRSQNLSAASMLQQQRDNARGRSPEYSFRRSALRAIGAA